MIQLVTEPTVGVALGILAPETFGRSLADYRWIIALAMVGIPGAMLNMLVANALAASQRGSVSAIFTLAIQAVLLAATVIGVYAAGMAGRVTPVVECGRSRPYALPGKWASTLDGSLPLWRDGVDCCWFGLEQTRTKPRPHAGSYSP